MGLRITSNILSLTAARNLSKTSKAIARALERLSTGQRINSARDDSAGLSISNGLEVQRRGLLQALRNVNEAQGYLTTAESALNAQSEIALRMQEIALSASNGSLSDADRANLDLELQQLMQEFQSITSSTQFNGVNLLDGSFLATQIQVGSKARDTIALSMTNMQASSVFTLTQTVGAGNFQARSTTAIGSFPTSIALADFNRDGYLDILNTSYATATISVSLGNGNGTFNVRTTLAISTSAVYDAIPIDINNDGALDILSTASSGATPYIDVFIGNGNGTFQTKSAVIVGDTPFYVAAGDVNGDGKMDFVSADNGVNNLSIALGNGNGTFQTRTTVATGSGPMSVSLGDYNRDGYLDILSADSGTISIFQGNGNGTFRSRTTIADGSASYEIKTNDFNGDGILDIASSNWSSNTVSIFLGNGNGTFGVRKTFASGQGPYSVDTADFNGDGAVDLVLAAGTDAVNSVLLGNGNGTFKARVTYKTGSTPHSVAAADLDGDGTIDIATADYSNGTASILLGNTTNLTSAASLSVATQSDAETALTVLSSAISYISSARASVAAFHSRLDFTSDFVQSFADNISEARSKILDVDLAETTAELVRQQILEQAGIAVLAQANILPQMALKLLDFKS